jgi:MoaA/NifB/PqqE/SkfB family radical SAM enzyme
MPDEAVSVLDGSNFVVSDRHGDLLAGSRVPPHGFFSEDTRFVSRWRLTVQGQPTDILSRAQVDYFVAQFFLISPSEAFRAAPPLGIVRQRLIGDVWMEDVVVVNHRDEHTGRDRRPRGSGRLRRSVRGKGRADPPAPHRRRARRP